MKSKILSCLSALLLCTSATNAAVIGWEIHNNTNHPVDMELWKHCMSDSAHDGPHVLAPHASYNYEELGTTNHGTCFFEASFIVVRIYGNSFAQSFFTQSGCFTRSGPVNNTDKRVQMTLTNDGCKLKGRFDINQ